MGIFSSTTQLILAIVLMLNAVLAFSVFRSNSKSATNIIFVFLSVATSLWLIAIYFSSSNDSVSNILLYTRLTVFLAVPQSVLFFLLAHTIPSKKLLIAKKYLYPTAVAAILVMILTLSPYVFTGIELSDGKIKSIPGFGMPIFALFTSFFSLTAIYVLFKKIKSSTGETKKQLMFMVRGIFIMLALIIGTIMIPVLFFQNQNFIIFSPVYALIFLGATATAIVRYHLFSLKVIATEASTGILWIMLLSKVFISASAAERLVDVLIFGGFFVFGIILIKSVRQEVRQREQLEVLTKQLEDANEKLQALDKARADFITIASHQLRTPPATIKWYLASILSGDYGSVPDEAKEQIVKANVTNNGLISLIDDLLNASRIERGKMEFFFEKNNMEPVAKSVFDQLEPMAIMKNLKIVYNKPKSPLPDIIFDKEKIRQVINNFIDNAIKYTKTGTITLDMTVDKEKAIKVSVTDTGKGIAPDVALSIFEKYTRGKDSVTHSTGLGLGLYVAKIIVEQHHGKIWAESPGVGQGSTFNFSIPIQNKLEATTFDLVEQKP